MISGEFPLRATVVVFLRVIQKGALANGARRIGWCTLALLLVGAGLRVGQYAIGAALWYDELAVARNIVEKSIVELVTQPLDHAQIVPVGFLLVEKLAVGALGNHEYALRLFPLFGSLVSLLLFAAVTRRLSTPGSGLIAVALFALSPSLISFGAQAKQYSTDVAAALLLTALTLRWWDRRQLDGAVRESAWLGVAGLVAVWFSTAAVLILAGVGVALLVEAAYKRDRESIRSLALVGALWGLGAISAVATGVGGVSPSTRSFMQGYWAEGFMPLFPWSAENAWWLWRSFRGFFQRLFLYPLPAAGVLLMLFGAIALARRRRLPALILMAPVGAALLASAAQQYPFGDRVSLFLVPALLLLMAEGLERVRRAAVDRGRAGGLAATLFILLLPVYTLYSHYPLYLKQEMPAVVKYVGAHRQSGDAIYLHHGAVHGVSYYGPRYGLPLDAAVLGTCPGHDTRMLLRELDEFRGRPRLWVIISHAAGPFREREAILGYLDTIGVRRDSLDTGGSAQLRSSAYLYDISDATRYQAVSAETHVLPEREPGVRAYPCVAEDNVTENAAPAAGLGEAP